MQIANTTQTLMIMQLAPLTQRQEHTAHEPY